MSYKMRLRYCTPTSTQTGTQSTTHAVCARGGCATKCSLLQGWGLIELPLLAAFSPAHPLADTFHPPYPPIASQSISRDVPLARARAFYSLFSHT
jgi:hypothetical protein